MTFIRGSYNSSVQGNPAVKDLGKYVSKLYFPLLTPLVESTRK